MMLATFGDSVRSTTDVAMKNELLGKIPCRNICCLIPALYDLGIPPVCEKMTGYSNNAGTEQTIG